MEEKEIKKRDKKFIAIEKKREEKRLNKAEQEAYQLHLDKYFMQLAIIEAKKAEKLGEIPIGVIIVYKNKIIAKAYNKRNTMKNTLAHAEILAINKACKYLGDWRLEGVCMYVTLEPCQMCAGALVQSRIDRVVYGAKSKKSGAFGSTIDLSNNDKFNHKIQIISGIREKECISQLKSFFKKMRKGKINDKRNK